MVVDLLKTLGLRMCVSLAFVTLGCASGSNPPVTPASTPAHVSPVDSAGPVLTSTVTVYAPGVITYDYRLTSTVQVVSGDSLPRVDSTQISAVLTATFTGSRPIAATVKADSIRVISGTPGAPPASGVQTQFSTLVIDAKTGKAAIQAPSELECTLSTISSTFRGDEVFPVIPEDRLTQAAWEDATSYQLCRGGVRLEVKRKTQYRAENSATLGQQVIVRTSQLEIAGTGVQWEQPVQAVGRGTATDTVIVTGAVPRVESVTGSGQLTLEFRSPMRRQTFLQTTKTLIKGRSQ